MLPIVIRKDLIPKLSTFWHSVINEYGAEDFSGGDHLHAVIFGDDDA